MFIHVYTCSLLIRLTYYNHHRHQIQIQGQLAHDLLIELSISCNLLQCQHCVDDIYGRPRLKLRVIWLKLRVIFSDLCPPRPTIDVDKLAFLCEIFPGEYAP